MLKQVAYIFGIVLIVIGILGFVPAANPGGLLLGFFHVNDIHNYIHIVSGLAAVGAAYYDRDNFTPKVFFQVFGVIYAVMALLGLYYGNAPIFGVIANNMADVGLHVVISVVSLYLGFLFKEDFRRT